jgi:hypothetical protein
LKFEYEKKQAAARTDKEKQQLRFEEELKRTLIEADFTRKQAAIEAEQKQKDTLARIEQDKKDLLAREQIRRNPGVLVYADIDAFYGDKCAALERFAADYAKRRHDGRYIAGALPALPFPDGSFDLVLTANFLMVYAPLEDGGMHAGGSFGLDFHLRSVEELARVTRKELRVPGMHTWKQPPERHPYCRPMMERLEALGFAVSLVASRYDDGCNATDLGCHQVLVARRP